MAESINIQMDQGSTFSQDFTFEDENGEPVLIDSYSIAAKMRKHPDSNTAYSFTGSHVSDGRMNLAMTPTETDVIPAGRYYYDVEFSLANNVYRVVEGVITVNPSATK